MKIQVRGNIRPSFGNCLLGLLTAVFCLLAQQDIPEAQKNPFAGSKSAIEDGRTVFDGACQGCHGSEARGGERAPTLAGGALKHGAADGEIFQNIRAGIRGAAMPAFAQLSTEQIWQLVSYIRSLAGSNSPVDAVAGDSECIKWFTCLTAFL
jgi:cbb3-type cytochrome c oxidase subunit III